MALYVYLSIIVIVILFIGIIWNSLDFTLTTSDAEFESMINDTNDTIVTYSLNTRNTIRNIWKYWPVFMFLVIMIWGIVAIQREDSG